MLKVIGNTSGKAAHVMALIGDAEDDLRCSFRFDLPDTKG